MLGNQNIIITICYGMFYQLGHIQITLLIGVRQTKKMANQLG